MQRIEGRPWWEPPLAVRHPGYFKVVASLILVHYAFAIDAMRVNAAKSPSFVVIIENLGGHLWPMAVFHSVIATLIVLGLYWPGHFWIMRLGCALSAVLFNVSAVALCWGAYLAGVSYFAMISCLALSLSSIAAAKEPIDGPGGNPQP